MRQLALPLPEADREYLRRFARIILGAEEGDRYLYDCWERLPVVLGWMDRLRREGVRKVLELGASPYLLTLLLERYFDFELLLANYFGPPKDSVHVVESDGERHEFPFAHFNVDTDPFPHADGSVGAVLFLEVIEHLLLSADRPIAEIRRVLGPGGYVIVTTPNAARLSNLVSLAKGRNIYDGYSPHGVYGRHNREYTLPEVTALLGRHGFEVVERRVTNVYRHPLRTRLVQALRPAVWHDHLFVLARKRG